MSSVFFPIDGSLNNGDISPLGVALELVKTCTGSMQT